MDARPLVMHIVFRFDTGGLENGVVNLINNMPAESFRHTVVALTDITEFRHRIQRDDVEFIALHKAPGHGVWLYPRLFKLFREHRPAIVHTRNLAALETQVPAWLAGVPVRIHGEHGREGRDLDGTSRLYRWLRRVYRPFVSHYIALSRDLAEYLTQHVGVPAHRLTHACNGVDTVRFSPAGGSPAGGSPSPVAGCPFNGQDVWLAGTVGRMQAVKNQPTLARAFVRALELQPGLRQRLRLVLVGDGPLRAECEQVLNQAGVADLCWLPGERGDVAEILRSLHCFVLPSLSEGISNVILEAMASGLPVIATAVGGNADLVVHGHTGEIVPPANIEALAAQLVALATDPARAAAMGRAARARAVEQFSIQSMVAAYQALYERELQARSPVRIPLAKAG